jgi:WD40 repeat protein
MRKQKISEQSGGGTFGRRIGLLAATLVAVVLVGALGVALVLSRSSHQTQVAAGNTPTATSVPSATPTPPLVGAVVHTQNSPAGMHAYTLAWSPNGTRVASIADDPSGTKSQLLIWDASTGGHLQTIPFATPFNEIHWSPTGKYLALANLKYIMIVDSQTGSVVKTFDSGIYVPPPTTNVGSPATGPQVLSSLLPQGGGYGFFSVAWTPDGSTLAVSSSQFTSSKIELLDPLTGAVKATLLSSYGQEGGLSFSSDGQYLAASNDEQVVVWRVASRSIVFQKNPGQSTSIAWQPGTHNLSVLLLYPDNLQLWDIDAQKVAKTYPGVGVFAWSLDGKEIAVVHASLPMGGPLPHTTTPSPTSGKVVILDAASGASVATYTSQEPSIVALAWSPDGRYIASIEGHAVRTSTGGSMSTLIRVWVA